MSARMHRARTAIIATMDAARVHTDELACLCVSRGSKMGQCIKSRAGA